MKKTINNNSGITLIVLVITVIVMTIIASIVVYEGKELISKSKAQTIETNMLTIQAKAKAYAEEIESKVWALGSNKESERTSEFSSKGLTRENDTSTEYTVTDTGLENMGLSELKGEVYVVIFSNNYKTIDVEYSQGIKYEGKTIKLLSELQKALSSEEE